MDEDAEREYVAAKAAYDAALVRLVAARKARPKRPTKSELRTAENKQIADAVWRRYLGGERNYKALAVEFGHSRTWIGNVVRDRQYFGRFGPETAHEYEVRMWLVDEPTRLKAARDAMIEEARLKSLEPGVSEAWLRAHRAFEEGRLRAAAEEC